MAGSVGTVEASGHGVDVELGEAVVAGLHSMVLRQKAYLRFDGHLERVRLKGEASQCHWNCYKFVRECGNIVVIEIAIDRKYTTVHDLFVFFRFPSYLTFLFKCQSCKCVF